MFGTAIRYMAKKPKPKMKPVELKTPPEQTQTITRVIFDILKEHGPLTISDTWERVKENLLEHEKFDDLDSGYRVQTAEALLVQTGLKIFLTVKEVGVRGLTSKLHMKIVLRWMRERQKLKLMCNHVGPHKQFLYTTWFTKANIKETKPGNNSWRPKLS